MSGPATIKVTGPLADRLESQGYVQVPVEPVMAEIRKLDSAVGGVYNLPADVGSVWLRKKGEGYDSVCVVTPETVDVITGISMHQEAMGYSFTHSRLAVKQFSVDNYETGGPASSSSTTVKVGLEGNVGMGALAAAAAAALVAFPLSLMAFRRLSPRRGDLHNSQPG